MAATDQSVSEQFSVEPNYFEELTRLRQENQKLAQANENLKQDVEVIDEENDNLWKDYYEALNALAEVQLEKLAKAGNVTHSRIRVYLSRQLTYSEVEKLNGNRNVISERVKNSSLLGLDLSLHVGKERRTIYVNGYVNSRDLYSAIAAALDAHFVNVHPEAVRTFAEYNG